MQEMGDRAPPLALRQRIIGLALLLTTINLGVWLWAELICRARPLLSSAAWLAYAFGLRHALDADHIAAIDNVTRKLLKQRQSPVGAGFFFALGHSSVVIALTMAVALGAHHLSRHFDILQNIGGIVGTSVSVLFLLCMAAANLALLFGALRGVANRFPPDIDDERQVPRGLLSRWAEPLFRLASKSWHLYPIGLLFGLGFDTATEVALFGLSVSAAAGGLDGTEILVLPALFAAGMSVADSVDGLLMLGVYRWAERMPRRKVYYDFAVTLISALIAVLVGGMEALQLLADHFDLQGHFWHALAVLEASSGWLGVGIVALFAMVWVIAMGWTQFGRRD